MLIRSCIHLGKLFRYCSISLHSRYTIFLLPFTQLKDNAYSKWRLITIFPFYNRHFLNCLTFKHSLYYLFPLTFPRSLSKSEKFRCISHNALDWGKRSQCFQAWLHIQCNICRWFFPLWRGFSRNILCFHYNVQTSLIQAQYYWGLRHSPCCSYPWALVLYSDVFGSF